MENETIINNFYTRTVYFILPLTIWVLIMNINMEPWTSFQLRYRQMRQPCPLDMLTKKREAALLSLWTHTWLERCRLVFFFFLKKLTTVCKGSFDSSYVGRPLKCPKLKDSRAKFQTCQKSIWWSNSQIVDLQLIAWNWLEVVSPSNWKLRPNSPEIWPDSKISPGLKSGSIFTESAPF